MYVTLCDCFWCVYLTSSGRTCNLGRGQNLGQSAFTFLSRKCDTEGWNLFMFWNITPVWAPTFFTLSLPPTLHDILQIHYWINVLLQNIDFFACYHCFTDIHYNYCWLRSAMKSAISLIISFNRWVKNRQKYLLRITKHFNDLPLKITEFHFWMTNLVLGNSSEQIVHSESLLTNNYR